MGPIGRNEKSEAASELNQLLVAVVGVACRWLTGLSFLSELSVTKCSATQQQQQSNNSNRQQNAGPCDASVTRSYAILPLCNILNDFGFSIYFSTLCMLLGEFWLLYMGQNWTNNLAIWSHWAKKIYRAGEKSFQRNFDSIRVRVLLSA